MNSSKMTSVRGAKISDKQKKILVENVKQLPSLVSGKFSASFSAEREWKKNIKHIEHSHVIDALLVSLVTYPLAVKRLIFNEYVN
jgi:hypothetical protein